MNLNCCNANVSASFFHHHFCIRYPLVQSLPTHAAGNDTVPKRHHGIDDACTQRQNSHEPNSHDRADNVHSVIDRIDTLSDLRHRFEEYLLCCCQGDLSLRSCDEREDAELDSEKRRASNCSNPEDQSQNADQDSCFARVALEVSIRAASSTVGEEEVDDGEERPKCLSLSDMRNTLDQGAYCNKDQYGTRRCAIEVVQHRNERVFEDLHGLILRVERVDGLQQVMS